MKRNHSRERFRSLAAINLLAWTAGSVFLYRNCNPAEEPLVTKVVEAPGPVRTASTSTSASAAGACTDYHCEFTLKDDSKVPREVRTFWLAQIGAVFAEIRERQLGMEKAGKAPLLTHEDPEISRLLRSLVRVNEKAAADYGYEPIPVSGPDDLERYRSLNSWLNRHPDSPLDERAVSTLDLKIVEAVMQ